MVEIGRTFKPTRSGTGSSAFASSHYAHASRQVLPLIRTLLKLLHHGLQARLRTFPDWLGDRGDRLLRFQVGQQEGRVQITLHRPTATTGYYHWTWWIIRRAPSERISGWVSPQPTLQRGCFILSVNASVPVFPSPNCLLLSQRASSRVLHAPLRMQGTGDKGWHSTSRAVHRRVVLLAAIAGVRCR